MRITKCDVCKKTIKSYDEEITIGINKSFSLCFTCGAPLMTFMNNHGFLDIEKHESEFMKHWRQLKANQSKARKPKSLKKL